MAVGDWTQEDVDNGLRSPTGQLLGGLNVLEYVQGRKDYAAGALPPRITSSSYDLGRRRASEEAQAKADVLSIINTRRQESDRLIRELLRGSPALLAEYDAAMSKHSDKQN